MDYAAISVFSSHMKDTNAHVQQALHLKVMEKPVIMVGNTLTLKLRFLKRRLFFSLYYYMGNLCNLIGLEQ